MLKNRKQEEMILEAIDAGLDAVGQDFKNRFYDYLERMFQVEKSEVPHLPHLIRIGLERIIGVGAKDIERVILQELTKRSSISFPGIDLRSAIRKILGRRTDISVVRIENILTLANAMQSFDLGSLAKAMPEAKSFSKFRGLLFKDQACSIYVYASGKIVCVGARTVEEANRSLSRLLHRLARYGIRLRREVRPSVRNIVGTTSMGTTLDLKKIAGELPSSLYEPEQFSGLIHRMSNPKVVISLFSSGKLVVTGARSEVDIYRAVNRLEEIIGHLP